MADQIITNEIPTTNTSWYAAVRLVEQLSLAGWVLVENSDGTAVSTVTEYFTGANYGSLGTSAWAIYAANSGQQILFRRGAATTDSGWIIWSKGGGFTTGGTATAPANIPADAAEVRGTFTAGTPGTFSTDGAWFGASTNTVATLNIGCRDASGTGDESFWVIAQVPTKTYDSTIASDVHRIAFEKLVHPTGIGFIDPTPYAWWCPQSSTGNWGEGMDDVRSLLVQDASGNTTGRWRRWWNAGQAGEVYSWYGSGGLMGGEGYTSGATQWQQYPTWYNGLDQYVYQATPQQIIHRVRLLKTLGTAQKDPEGGITSNIFFTETSDVPNLSTLANGAYAKFGKWVTVWWDGNNLNPPVEN